MIHQWDTIQIRNALCDTHMGHENKTANEVCHMKILACI